MWVRAARPWPPFQQPPKLLPSCSFSSVSHIVDECQLSGSVDVAGSAVGEPTTIHGQNDASDEGARLGEKECRRLPNLLHRAEPAERSASFQPREVQLAVRRKPLNDGCVDVSGRQRVNAQACVATVIYLVVVFTFEGSGDQRRQA